MTYSEWQKKYGKKIADNKTSATNNSKEIAEKAENWHKKYNPPKTVSAPTKTTLKTVADATGGVFAGSSPEKKLADVKTALTGINGISRDSIVKANPTTYVNNTGRVLTRNDGGTAESRTAEANQRLAAAKEANEKRQKENERLLAIDIDAYKNRAAEMKAERERLQKQLYPVVEDKMQPGFATKENKQDIQRRITSLNKQIGNIEADIYNAEKANRSTGYNDLPKNEDFADKSVFNGKDAYTGDKDKNVVASYLQLAPDQYKSSVLHDYINGSQYAIDAVNAYDAEVRRKSGNAGEFLRKYRMMTNDEKSRYNYLYNSKRYTEADQYLADIEGDLNARLGQDIANGLNDAQRVALGFSAGVENFVEGTAQLFTDKVKPVSVKQNAGQAAREHLGNVGQFAYDFAQIAGNMAPSILLSAVTGGAGAAVGSISMGASAAGNAYAEMMRETGNRNKAITYAGLVGASEAALSYALSGIGKLGGKAINATKLAKNIATIDSIWARTAAQFAKSGISEGFEETLQEYLEPLFYASIYGGDYEAPDVKDALRTFALAALSGGVFEGPSIVAGAVADSANQTAYINDVIEAVYKSDNGMLDRLISDSVAGNNGKKAQKIATALQEKIADGKEVSGADIRKLATPAAKHNKNRVTAESLEKNKAATASMLDSYIAKHLDSKKPKTGLETAKQEMERKTEGVRRADADAMLKNPSAVEALKEYGYDPAAKDKVASVRAAIKKMAAENVTGTMAVDSAIARYTKEVAADSVPIKTEATEVTADTAENNIPAEAKFEPTMNTNENTEVIDNAEGDLHLRYGSERNDGADSYVQLRKLEESAGRDSVREETADRPADEGAASLSFTEEVNSADVIEGGLNKVRILKDGDTESTRKAKQYAKERGLELVLFGGDNLLVEHGDRIVSAKGAIRDGKVYVRVDHHKFTADQIVMHEITHDKINKGEINPQDVRNRLNDILDPAEVQQLVDMYLEAYHGSRENEDAIFVEIICDAEAGMNEFAGGLQEDEAGAQKLIDNTRKATADTVEANKTRGPPAESAETQFSEEKKTSAKKEKTDVITIGMSDSERAEILSKKVVSAPVYLGEADTAISDNRDKLHGGSSVVKEALIRIGEEFGVFYTFNVDDIDVQIPLSRRGVRESAFKGADTKRLVKLFPVLRESVKNAIGIEKHENRYFYDDTTAFCSELLGAYVDGENIVPVRYGLKHMVDGQNVLYIVVDQPGFKIDEQKNKTGVLEAHPGHKDAKHTARPVYKVSIPQIAENVNTKDLLRYLPDDFLSENQLAIKWEGIAETIQYTNNKNDERYAKYIRNRDKISLENMVNAAANAAGYTELGYHGTDAAGFTVVADGHYLWLAKDRDVAATYGPYHEITDDVSKKPHDKNGVYALRYRLGKNLEIDADGNSWGDLPISAEDYPGIYVDEDTGEITTDAVAEWAESNGYDSVRFKNVDDGGLTTVDVVFNPKRDVKSADAITYDDNDNVIPISERFNEQNDDIRFSEELDIETRKEHDQIAIDHFGKTNKWDETGYILLDGSRLDFSGRHDGAEGGYRTVDHRDIRDALGEDYGGKDYSGGMVQFMAEGNIRVMPESNGLNLSVAPTKEQERTIEMFVARKHGEIILDIDDVNGKTVSSTEYPRGTTATRVLSDIHRFFEEGSTPRVSSVAMFHDTDFSEEISEIQDLRKENARLRKQLAHWKNEVKVTERPTVRRDDVEKIARRIRKDYHSTLPLDKVTEHINELANFLARHEDVTWNGMRRMTEGIARQIVESAEVLNDEAWKSYKEMRDYIRSHKFVLSPGEASSIADFAAWKKLNRKYFGGIEIGKTNVDKIYSEMSSLWPEFFDEQREPNPAEQMLTIVETMDKLKPVFENPYDFNLSAATEYVANDIMESILSPDLRRVKTYADRANEKLQRAKQKRIDDLRKRTQSANARAVRDKIIRHSSKLYNDLGTIRKDRNIPEHLRAPVAAVLEAINFESKNTVVENENGKRVIAPKGVEGDPTKRTQKFEDLKKAYRKLTKDGELVVDPNILGIDNEEGVLDEVIAMRDKRLDDMNVHELQKVWDVVKSMETAITNWNKAFRAAKDESISDQAYTLLDENAHKDVKKELSVGSGILEIFEVDELTPEAYFHRLGEKGDELYRMLRNAQDDSIRVLKRTAAFTSKLVKKEDIRKLSRVVYSVKLGGKDVKMTAAQLMELYILANRGQAMMHIMAGGIRLDSQNVGKLTKLSTPEVIMNITPEELTKAFDKLTEDQKKIANALQKFTSTVLSEYGNKASMEVYGVKKFLEEFYWPIRTHNNDTFREQAQTKATATSYANKGFTKAVKADAKTSLRIGSVFDTFSNHAVEMANYYGYLAAMEDLNRIRNFKFAGRNIGSVGDLLNRAVGRGQQGAEYLETLMKDISVGTVDGGVDISPWSKLVGNYKAASVSANLRVVFQQPTAGLRAMSMINPKYFVGADNPIKGFEMAKRYAPIAQWKDWGYFETNTGRQVMDIMFNTDSTLDKVKNKGMWAAGAADSVTWGMLWNACVRETKAKNPDMKAGTALYKKAAERFNDIVNRTQVVDGVLQRSQIMRASGLYTKLATAFMAEPTKTVNMFTSALYDLRNAKDPAAKKAAGKQMIRTAMSLSITGIVNATIGTSIIDMIRDDDDEQTYWEKYLESLVGITGDEEKFGDYLKSVSKGNLADQFNPLSMLPHIKDVWSILQGYDAKSLDDAAISNLYNAVNNLRKSIDGTGKKTILESVLGVSDAAAAMAGIPVKNVRRAVVSMARMFVGENPVSQYHFNKTFYRPSENKGKYYDIAYAAYTTDEDAYNTIKKDLMKSGFSEDDIESAMLARTKKAFDGSAYAEEKFGGNAKLSSELKSIAKEGKLENIVPNEVSAKISWKDDKDVEHTVVLDEKDYKKYQQAVVDRAYGILTELTKNSKWKSLTDEQKQSAVSDVYSVARAYGKKQVSAYETETNWLMVALENAEYADEIAMFNILKKNYDKDKNGSLKQAELKEAIREIGSTRAERAALWDAASSNKDWKKRNPYD